MKVRAQQLHLAVRVVVEQADQDYSRVPVEPADKETMVDKAGVTVPLIMHQVVAEVVLQ